MQILEALNTDVAVVFSLSFVQGLFLSNVSHLGELLFWENFLTIFRPVFDF